MKIKSVKFDPIYLSRFTYEGTEREYFPPDDREVRMIILNDVLSSEEVTVGLLGDEVVYIAGIRLLSSRVGESWLYLNPVEKRYHLQVVRSVRKDAIDSSQKLDLIRLQSLCLPIYKNRRFLTLLGFEYETTLHKYFNGIIDIDVYVIFFGGEKCQAL